MTDIVLANDATDDSRGHAVHSDAVWEYARRDYLDGDSAGVVCKRYGIARSTFWDRAAAGEWRRRDQPPAALPPVSSCETFESDDLTYFEMIDLIHLRLTEAIKRGRATEVAA